MQPTTPESLLTLQDIAKLFKINVRTARRWLVLGRIPKPLKVTQRTHRWRASEILQLINPTRN